MKRLLPAAGFLILLASPLASASSWEIDSNHTSPGFSVTHMMVSTVRGSFGKTTGTLELDEKDVTKSKVEISIDVTSVDTRVADRDNDLRSDHFFDAAKNPAITFKSTKVESAGKGKLKVTGDLTMRGITKPVTLDVTGPSDEFKSPWGQITRGASATAKISRKDWGLVWNKTLEKGGVLVSDEVTLEIEAEFHPKK